MASSKKHIPLTSIHFNNGEEGKDELELRFERFKASRSSNAHSSGFEAELCVTADFICQEQYLLEERGQSLLKNIIFFTEAKKNEHGSTQLHVQGFNKEAQELHQLSLSIKRFAAMSSKKLCSIGGNNVQFLSEKPWTYIAGGTNIVTLLSDIHDLIRSIEEGNTSNERDKWVAPLSFERYTHKYWVDEDFLSDVMLSCTTEVPLLVYGKSGLLNEQAITKGSDSDKRDMTDIWEELATPITSIYFDSPSMVLYEDRIARREGAMLLRVRWYGKKPHGEQLLFLELKTHHEQWVSDKSVKQRVNLREQDMQKLLARDGVKWTRQQVEELVALASPTLEGDPLNDAVDLLHKIRKLIIKKDLRPCVRTRYRRAAFQSAKSNALRLTIDRDITMVDESGAVLGEWSLPEDIIKNADCVRVPCAVFEVKLSGSSNPEFMDDLLQSKAIEDGQKFSKFLTGAATFNVEKVQILPYWARIPMFEPMFRMSNQRLEEPAAVNNMTTEISETTISSTSTGSASMIEHPRRGSALSTISVGMPFSRSSSRSFFGQDKGEDIKEKKVAPKKRARVEPKTYFANERTYIQWVSAALLLVTISALLLAIAQENGLQAPKALGVTLIFTALFITCYALFVYFRRLYLLTRGLPYGYTDHAGPVILTAAVLMGIFGLLFYTFNSETVNAVNFSTVDSSGQCHQHFFGGISILEYQPSDIVVDDKDEILIIPSQTKLTGLPIVEKGEQVLEVLANVPGADFEAVTYAGNRVYYAVAEKKKSSILMAFIKEYNDEWKVHFRLVGEWKLKRTSLAEGMAYVPDEDGGKLYVSEVITTSGEINVHVYSLPSIDDESLEPIHQLNAKLLSLGISENPKIGSMTFFEDVLYILHDNARTVRGWNLTTGTMVSEWMLPRVGGGFDQQWEGLSMRRIQDAKQNSIRGSSASSTVILYLTLDTPPQIWSFRLQGNKVSTEVGGNYILPDCAAAY